MKRQSPKPEHSAPKKDKAEKTKESPTDSGNIRRDRFIDYPEDKNPTFD
jgi:hypothetical protein